MIILSIDPGIAHTGWAILEFTRKAKLIDCDVIRTKVRDGEDWERAYYIQNQIQRKYYNLPSRYKIRLKTLLIEKYHFYLRKDHNVKNGEKTIRVIQAIETWGLENMLNVIELDNQKIRPYKEEVEPIFNFLTQGVKLPSGDHAQDAIYQGLVWYYFLRDF